MVVLAIAGTLILVLTRGTRVEINLFLAALALRFAASILIYEVGLVDVIGDDDAQDWMHGWHVKRVWEMYGVGILELPIVLLDAFDTFNRGYLFFLAAVYMIWDFADPGRLVAAAVNGFSGAMTVVLVYRAARELFDAHVARVAGWLTCLFPSLIVWSAQTLKEPVVIFLGTFVLYMCLRLFRTRNVPAYVCLAAAAAVLIVPFRLYGGYIAAGVIVLTLVLRGLLGASPGTRRAVSAAGVVVGATVAALVVIVFAERESKFVDFEYLAKIKQYSSTVGGSSVELPFDVETPIGFILSSIFGALHVLFAPFPWQWFGGSTRLLFTVPEIVAWWIVFWIGVWPGIRRAFRERLVEMLPVLLFLFCFGFLYSAMFGNVGLAYRQRAQLLPWLLVFAAAGLVDRWRHLSATRRWGQTVISREERLPA